MWSDEQFKLLWVLQGEIYLELWVGALGQNIIKNRQKPVNLWCWSLRDKFVVLKTPGL